MFLKCAHPECPSDFDYGQGRFFRFHQSFLQDDQPANSHSVRHYWLCDRCCETYTIEYQRGLGVLLRKRLEMLVDGDASHFVLRPEFGGTFQPKRVRGRKRKGQFSLGKSSEIEILEKLNLERRREQR